MIKHITTGLLVLSLCTPLAQGTDNCSASLQLSQNKVTLAKGSTCTLNVNGLAKNNSVTWKSCNEKIAAVNKKGVITAKKKGTTTITAKVKKQKLSCKITVTPKCSATTAPSATQKPAATQKPTATKAPAATQAPTATKTPTATQTPAATKAPAATQAPAATKAPSATASPSSVTEEKAYQILNSLRSTYPEGMTLTNSYYYYSPCFGNGYGCYGFAAKLSDTVFGTGKSCSTHTSFENIKVGDNIRIGNSHSVIVLTKSDNAITVVEGNYNSSVHWDRTITKASLAKDGFKVTTRY